MLLVIAAYLHQHTWGKCISEELGDTAVNLSCSDDNEELVQELSYLQYRSYTLNTVNIFLENIYSHPIIHKSVIKELFTPVVTLTVTNTVILDLNDVLVLSNVSELTVYDCSLTKINFDDVLILNQARKLNISYNSISVIKSAKPSQEQQLMQTIDLSHNAISNVPDNCFNSFSHLKHLNLSHNSISHLSVAAFEGISQLESLYLSYNKLLNIANIATKLRNLKTLHLDYNFISNIEDLNLMISLEHVKLGHNEIKVIEANAFETLPNLKTLDLSGNGIIRIRAQFINNNYLQEVRLTDNSIVNMGTGSFDGKRLTNFFINGNKNVIPILDSLYGVDCDYLDVSNCNLKHIFNISFHPATFRSINLSSNALSLIEESAFSNVKDLQVLDLSYNALDTLVCFISDVNTLKRLFVQKNMLNQISKNMFANLPSLELLDLSYNAIQSIEPSAFSRLKMLEIILLHNNRLLSVLAINLQGLSALYKFDVSYTGIGNFTQAAVTSLQTTIFNCSHAQLSYIHFDTFAEIEHIEILDLSHNSLAAFEVNPKGMSSLEELYLNSNKITSISYISFAGLNELRELHLEFNNILTIHPKAFSPLKSLRILHLSDNRDLQVTGEVFSNLRVLVFLTMINNKKQFNFQHTENITSAQVDFSLCDIEDIDSLYVFNIKGVVSLNLSRNLIGFIDKKSFKAMPKLKQIDLSFNLIKTIEPGSFINTNNVALLNLHRNQLSYFQHGVFQGLTNLLTLNLSNNVIHEFNINLLHRCSEMKEISFENNLLIHLELKQFTSMSSVKKFYIGGNNISCHELASFKKYLSEIYYTTSIVASETPNYHTDNVDGVTCRPDKYSGNNDANFTMNTTYISKFTDSLENIRKSIDNYNQDYYVKGIFHILIIMLIASIIFVVVKYIPIQRLFIIVRKPLNGNLSHSFSYNNISQRISNNDD